MFLIWNVVFKKGTNILVGKIKPTYKKIDHKKIFI